MRPPEAHRAGSSTGRVGFVGRQAELRLLADRLAVASGGQPQVVYVEGEAGAGKSSLLSKFVGSLSDAVVVEVGGDEAEVLLSYGVIDQLQRGATTEPGTDPMAVGAWLLERLDDLQVGGRVVVLVIDDLQWIDRPSSRAVLFALRRLRADRVLTVVATRPGDLADAGWVRFVAGDGRVSRLRLRGLNPEELTEMARALGLGVLTERGASRLAVHTRGNALHCRALLDEIGAADLSAGEGELPAPRALSAVILSRIASLPAATQAFLAAASVLGQHAPLTSIRSVARWPAAEGEVDGAVAAGLLSEGVSSSELAFTHPLYRAAVYADLSPTLRRELHGRAAEILGGWPGLTHRVAAAPGPDDALAGDLEAAASAGTAEGDVGTAAWALEQAAFLSSTGEERERRLLDAAVALLNASDSAGAARILSFCESSSARLDALTGLLGVFTGSLSAENRLLAAWQAHDPRKDREIGVRAATSMANLMVIFGRPEQALTWGDRAVDGAAVGSTLWVMAQVAKASAFAAANRNPEGLSSLSFLAVPGNEVPVAETDALIMRGMLKVYADDLPGALADLGVSAARLRAGLASTYPGPCLTHLSDAYFRRGDWDAAVTHAELACSRAQDADHPLDLARAHARAAQVLACRGEWSAARFHLSLARAAAERFPAVLAIAAAATAGASLASAGGDLAGVLVAVEPVRATRLLGVGGCPGIFNWRAAEADALIGLGRLDEAVVALDEFEMAVAPSGLPSAALMLARSRGNLAVATGDGTLAATMFARAHATGVHVMMPFEHALLSLDDGRRLRAAGDRPAAVAQIEKARRLFSGLGADPYEYACATELATLKAPVTAAGPTVLLGLTRAEMAVARLVAAGLTNREAAAQLYVSVKTVEYHLRNSYMKLGITSRRALAALFD